MANRKLDLAAKYLTAPQVAGILGLSREKLNLRIKRGIFPPATMTSETNVRYFDRSWVNIAKAVMAASSDGENK